MKIIKTSFILLSLLLVAILGQAQTIDFTLPKDGNKKYIFLVPNGLKYDTIATGVVSPMGIGQIKLLGKYKGVPSMGVLEIADRADINVVLEEKSFSISMLPDGNISFRGSKENELLNNQQLGVFDAENKNTFAQFYVNTLTAMKNVMRFQSGSGAGSLFERTDARLNLIKVLDVDKLYYSKFWYFAIDGLLKLSIGQEGFAADMIKLLDKTKTDKVYVAFVEDLIMLTTQFGLDDAFDQIILHVKDSGRILYPQGSVYDAFTMLKVRKGTIAPEIKGLEKTSQNYHYNLLIFHQPGCDHCYVQLTQLNKELSFFEHQKVRIISISGAMDKQAFEEGSSMMLWNDKLSDFKGFAGDNFMNFGVVATPVLYLLDAKRKVLGRFSSISDVQKCILETNQ